LANPPLSSISPNAFQSGQKAAETLTCLLEQRLPASYDCRIDPSSITTRRSTDVLAIDDRIVTKTLSYIRQNACTGVTVNEVAERFQASRSKLEKKFRHHLGRSPQAEIRRVQVEKIKQLLVETDHSLKQIAELTGFEHCEYMSVVFKRLTAETPGAFRKRVR
jgi:LacI family transcriptional regulator